ncbi:MAG: hypothetical protein HBSAPP04_11230 [Ignavibacteriaceae bacterium]|nr:MAG: DinB family protein [Chlorobiota bacterium]GJQ32284.1 MAG: hypothetical protein HBSAPP04_11230 [Ignavibacteriaceae bacterium]
MHTQIDTLINDLTAMTSESLSIVNNNFIGLSETQINWKPEKKKWSIAECLDHIAVSFKTYNADIERVLASPQPASGNLVFRTTLTGGIFIKTMHPDSPVKVPNPSMFSPTQGNLTRGVFEDFLAAHKALTDLIEKSKTLDLGHNKITSPVSSLMKFTLGEVLIILTYHEKRHVLQARRVMELPGFPL